MRMPLRIIRAVLFAAPLLLGSVQAQVVVPAPPRAYPVSHAAETVAVSAEMDVLLAEMEHIHAYSLGDGMSIGMLHQCEMCYAPGWSAGVEVAILKPYLGSGVFLGDPDSVRFDRQASPRFHLAHRSPLGLGFRGRYHQFDDSTQVVAEDQTVYGAALELQAADLEVTKVLYLSGVHWDLGAGARYAKVDIMRDIVQDLPAPFDEIQASKQVIFEGVGPSFFIEGRHRFGMSQLSAIGNLRASMLVGRQRFIHQWVVPQDPPESERTVSRFDDKIVPVLESQIGIEWARPMPRGRLFVRAMAEGQWWSNAVTPAFDPDLGPETPVRFRHVQEDLGLLGITLAVSYVW